MDKDASQLLREAGELVEKGWVRGSFYQSGRYCSIGALRQSAFGVPWQCKTSAQYRYATQLLARVMSEQFDIPMSWVPQQVVVAVNDEHAKNGKEIVACFEKAANLAEEGR
jgi:hypothetical protein